ncbi:DUF4902 domain-containing protein [Rhodanobacter sp. Root179]|uniref:DUF4902 domain-containing protein n=1 Tax=Rhodanobacter sp. Root179 TaxID=1736482 RepID=UPI0006F20645|nr:DUF4902 domain-containing protein [Rhodanobacter sp. Root179]KRB40782.1 hypothetical protein ASD82_09800 [Rhodanobacter sp. Root179]
MISVPPLQGMSLSRSFDGYIRITFDAFSSLDFPQRLIWEDPALCEELVQDDIPAFNAGYCEWATEELPDQVSVGWAWFRSEDGHTLLAPGGISTNVMLVAAGFHDLGFHKTHELLQSWLTGEQWQPEATAWNGGRPWPRMT